MYKQHLLLLSFLCCGICMHAAEQEARPHKTTKAVHDTLEKILKSVPRSVGMIIAHMAEERLVKMTIERYKPIKSSWKGELVVLDVINIIIPTDSTTVPVKYVGEFSRKKTTYEAQTKRILFKNFYDTLAEQEPKK